MIAVIYCAPRARRLSGEALGDYLKLPETLPASRALAPDELQPKFVSAYLRSSDVPLAFHRESEFSPGTRHHLELASRLEAQGRIIQYLFSDGLILTAHQVLYHPHSKVVPRHVLPLTLNVRPEERTVSGRPSWQTEAEQVAHGVLMAALRAAKIAKADEETKDEAISVLVALEDRVDRERQAMRLEEVETAGSEWGPWRINCALPEPGSGVHYGRARLELDPDKLSETAGLAENFLLDVPRRRLMFHSFEEQVQRLRTQAVSPVQMPEERAEKEADHALTVHLSGHANIQATISEINELWRQDDNRLLSVHPRTLEVDAANARPRLSVGTEGHFKIETLARAPDGTEWELHGLPQGMTYLLFNLQLGLGATTGYANAHIAHARRGLKRERDMKILRHLGYSALIFMDAMNFARGLALSDGAIAKSESEVCESLYRRLGSLVLKSEGWPVTTGSLAELCSSNVTTLIEGFVRQIVSDYKGRPISVFLPQGEIRVDGLSRAVALLFHAMVSDLADATSGGCFLRARTKYFENFMNGRTTPEREDLAVRAAVDQATSARLVYQPGIGERYLLPEASFPPRGKHLLGLLHEGFELSIDGKGVEEFEASEFRPEFTLREDGEEGGLETIPLGSPKINWFELHPKFFFKGVEITGDQATRLSKDGMLEFQGKLYRVKTQDMPSLQRLTRFWASIQGGPGAGLTRGKRRKTEETYYPLPRSQTLELLALRASGVKVRGGEKWDSICKFYDSLNDARPSLALPESFKTRLQPYQETGVQWIRDIHGLSLGGILADDMGLGKTVTTLAFLELLRTEEKMGAVLILVPTSLTYNWLAEGARFAPEMPVTIFSSREPEAMLDFVQNKRQAAVICTYGLLQEHSELFQQVPWNCVVYDEAQNLKNITTKRTTAARKLSAEFKLCLTGTPLENHYGELYSLFDLIVPGSLGDIAGFRERYVNPLRVLREDIDFLKLKTKPLLLRRTKAQVMHELPPKIESTVQLPFEEEQRKIYRDIATSYNDQIRTAIARQGEAKSQLQMLTALLRLRQACSDPASIPGVKYHGEPPKVATLLEAITELTESGASALVFTQFLATYERIRFALTQAKIRHYDISGADSRASREKKLRAFQEDEAGAVMLMTLKTGGVGLNLVKASYIFHIEPWWNPAVENQATDRAHRIGQTKTVQVYRYIIKDSVEEKIEVLKSIKSQRFDALFAVHESESELQGSKLALSQQDFEFLLS